MAFELVVVGTSLGGLRALQILFAGLPQNFPASLAIVQHRHKASESALSVFLQRYSALPIVEPNDKEAIAPGYIYLAPADYHLLIEGKHSCQHRPYFALSTDAVVEFARPSINVLFESAADAYAEKVIGVVLTGSNRDGAQGLAKIKARGGMTVVQEPATAEGPTMPSAAIEATQVDWILPLVDISAMLVKSCGNGPMQLV